ncbi:MAG: acyltransferase domain-containing protein, partial [bacterium]
MGRLRPTTRGVVWQQKSYPRRASVSAMGFGGANSHIALEEANPHDAPPQEDLAILGSNQETELVLISAQTADHLARKVEHLFSIAERICRAELTDLSAALAKEPLKGDIRLAIVTDDPRKLAASLKAFSAKLSEGASPNDLDDPDAGIFAGKAKKHPTLVGLFPGQGSQIVNMGEYLLQRYPFVVNLYERADKALTDIIPEGIKAHILLNPYAYAETIQKSFERNLQDTRITQPTVVLSSIATLNVLGFLGLKPDAVIGHSLGEISAYHAAGVCSDIAALRIAAARGRAMASLTLKDSGGMAAVGAAPDVVERLIAPFEKKLIISNYNSPRQTVVSGESDAIDKIVELCRSQGIRSQRLPVSHAFHSHLVAPAAKALRTFLEGLEFRNPSSAMISTISAQQVKKGSEVPELLIEQISKPVRFVDAVERAAERKPDLWVEIGPGGVLTALVRSILGNGKALCFPTNVNDEDSSLLLNNVLAKAFVLGFPVARERLFAHRYHRPFSLDSYHPQFIVNPCERPVPAIDGRSTTSDIVPATLMPGEADGAALEHYLASRGQFLRDFITLDFRHFQEKAQTGGSEAAPAPDKTREKPIAQEQGVSADPETVLRFAIDWISGRTGFPVSSISADMKLREDLNLDSIKAGELAISLSRKFGGVFRKDPSTLANATVSALVEALEIKSFTEKRRTRADVAPVHVTTSYHDLPDRIRTFSVVPFPIPLEREKNLPLPAGSRVIIMNDSDAAKGEAIAREFQARGHTVTILDGSVPLSDGEMVQRATAIIYILKAEEKTFFTRTPAEFIDRVEGFGTRLFQLFHDMVRSGESADTGFRALVLRPCPVRSDKGIDIDG